MRQKYPKFQSICSSPIHLLSPGKPEEIAGISDKPWNVPAWVLGQEKGGENSWRAAWDLHPPSALQWAHSLTPGSCKRLLQARAPSSCQSYSKVGKAKSLPRDGHGREAEENSEFSLQAAGGQPRISTREANLGSFLQGLVRLVGFFFGQECADLPLDPAPGDSAISTWEGITWASPEGAELGHGKI